MAAWENAGTDGTCPIFGKRPTKFASHKSLSLPDPHFSTEMNRPDVTNDLY